MTVYVLTRTFIQENITTVLGVFSSEEKCRKFIAGECLSGDYWEYEIIKEVVQ